MTSPGRPGEDYAQVRRALEERGYLKTPLERIFLDAGGGGRDRFGAVLRIAGLSGLFAGVPVGVLLAGALVVESRGLVPLWPDGVLYAALFAPFATLLAASAEVVVALVVRLLARRRRGLSPWRASQVTGLGAAVMVALYLGLWWAGSERRLGAADLAALAALALGAGLSGRVLSAAVLVQAALGAGRAPRQARSRGGRWLLPAALASVAVAAVAATLPGGSAATAGAPVVRSPHAPARALLIGWDGLDLPLLDGLTRSGRSPWLAACRAAGRLAPITDEQPGDPAATWTTIATGSPPARHGVRGASVPGLRGTRAPAVARGLAAGPLEVLVKLLPTRPRAVRAGVRLLPTFWEITAQAEKTAIVGWWGSWPAGRPGPAGGYLVSDGALPAAEGGEGLEQAIYPEGWAPRAARWLERARSGSSDLPGEIARLALRVDLFRLEALAEALGDPEVSVATIYLPGLDILREGLRREGVDPFRRLEAVASHVERIDARLAQVVGLPSTENLLAVAGAPGRNPAAGPGWFLLARGKPGRSPAAVAEDIAPTWLAAAGYPVDSRMSGRARADLAGVEGQRLRKELTRAEVRRTGEGDVHAEARLLERLRSLGYVQ
ncbi:MAG: alkaline phosphatase family protein [Acidobacteriota bacterium]|nr:alkaline phosphatase family protein [Acidobacteriota bacterium]MDQ7086515.1 alkaline phosphatase family protein [Acidobacteriota bacterium]